MMSVIDADLRIMDRAAKSTTLPALESHARMIELVRISEVALRLPKIVLFWHDDS
jgi:hypothetical protein